MIDLELANRLKKAILQNYTYAEMSTLTGINQKTLLRIANGNTDPKFSHVAKISRALNTGVEDLAFGSPKDQMLQVIEENIKNQASCSASRDLLRIVFGIEKLPPEDVQIVSKTVDALVNLNLKRGL